ncbi:MAG: hypothetical protein WBW81_06085 [Methylocella sp.]
MFRGLAGLLTAWEETMLARAITRHGSLASSQAEARNDCFTGFRWRRRIYLGEAPHATLPRRDNGLN